MLISELVTDVEGQTDVLLMGMTDGDGYSRLSIFNPIHCRNKALSALFNSYHENALVRKDGIMIVANPFEPKFSLLNHPSYHVLYNDVLPHMKDPVEVWDTYSKSMRIGRSFSTNTATALPSMVPTPVFSMVRGSIPSIT